MPSSHQLVNISSIKTAQDALTAERLLLDLVLPEGNLAPECRAILLETVKWVGQKPSLHGRSRFVPKVQNLVGGLDYVSRVKGYNDEQKLQAKIRFLSDQLKGNGSKDGKFRPELYFDRPISSA